MFCHKCGKEIPDGARFCNFCGAQIPETPPKHAKPEGDSDELFSYSEENRPTEFDVNDADKFDKTKVYNFSAFEEDASSTSDDFDDRELIDDSYENYQDGEDDDTFMDKLDNRFRRDDEKKPQNNKTWLWITLGVLAAVLIIVFAILAFSGTIFKGNNVKPTAPTTATTATTAKATEAPKATQAPEPTRAPATEAPEPPEPVTEAPVITEAPAPATEAPAPATEAPAPVTEAPRTETQAPAPTEAPEPIVSETEIVQE